MTVQEIVTSKQESGIILFPEAYQAICCNWSSIDGIPRVDPFGFGIMGLGENLEVAERRHVESWQDAIEGYNLIFDKHDTVATTPDGPAEVIVLTNNEITIVAPDEWA